MLLIIAFIFVLLIFQKLNFKYDWHPKVSLWGTVAIILFMLFINGVLNFHVKLRYITAFFLGGIHFSMCLKFFSFGHVMFEIRKVLMAMKTGTYDANYAIDDISEAVSL